MRMSKKMCLLGACILLAAFPAGCTHKNRPGGEDKKAAPAETAARETEDPGEAETEPVTEAFTEEMEFRSIREVLDGETLTWADSFNADDADRMVYTNLGETPAEYEVKDRALIVEFYNAIMELTVAGLADTYVQDAGDTYDFYMKDGSSVRFSFCMGSLLLGDQIYETDQSDRLWELTGNMIPEEDL